MAPAPRVRLPPATTTSQSTSAGKTYDLAAGNLRQLVLEYLEHNCYGGTLRALQGELDAHGISRVDVKGKGKETVPSPMDVDLVMFDPAASYQLEISSLPPLPDDHDDDMLDMNLPTHANLNDTIMEEDDEDASNSADDDRSRMALRTEIRNAILSGDIAHATSLLETHFPSVIRPSTSTKPRPQSHTPPAWLPSLAPPHISLNLRIQAFIESLRSSSSTSITHSLALGRALNAEIGLLKDAHYTAEWALVGALLAYSDPETEAPVSMRRYMTRERKEAVAAQVDRAVLWSLDLPPASKLECAVRQNMAVWSASHDLKVPLDESAIPPGIDPPIPPVEGGGMDAEMVRAQKLVPLFDFHEWMGRKAVVKSGKDARRSA
ncbi:hypothetical protein EXIGLDRAFT_836465 [Exidia glandulosa HHB12029]|uniref:CTLH/CRA C-terminal to LisH motif domain-containing protein n=1 Tax=Exidia glandulosa HHB12029 TaxID=1314781 RepID=A0A166AJF5_EXIGL|nr:hypothetical protein EXIGLDRAFT_836465 [Exidia glandulosa HHB12029]